MRASQNYSGAFSIGYVQPDQLGSVGKFYPYGENRSYGSMFATYTRDGNGLDYALNRYYNSVTGRFITPDPYRAAAASADNRANPGSWNRYAYVQGDPVNFNDPVGLIPCGAGGYATIGPDGTYTYHEYVYDCIGLLGPVSGPRGHAPFVDDVRRADNLLREKCPGQAPRPGLTDIEIRRNVQEALAKSSEIMHDAETATALAGGGDAVAMWASAMAVWLKNQFQTGGEWDYKNRGDLGVSDPTIQAQLRDFGNFNFGAVMSALGMSYYFTQNTAGAAQILLIDSKYSEGIPLVVFPFGDSTDDSVQILTGWRYGTYGCL